MADRFLGNTSAPLDSRLLGPDGKIAVAWRQWFGRMPDTLDAIPSRLNAVTLRAQAASLPATDFSGYVLLEGMYRATYHAQITQAASTSSSLTVTFYWTENGVLQTATGTAITGNTTATGQSDSIILSADAGTQVQYATTYTSVGATPMQYALKLALEKIKA